MGPGNILARSIDLRIKCSNSKTGLSFSKLEDHFQKLKKIFWSNEKYFLLTIILHSTKHWKIQKIFFKYHFTSKQRKPKINLHNLIKIYRYIYMKTITKTTVVSFKLFESAWVICNIVCVQVRGRIHKELCLQKSILS